MTLEQQNQTGLGRCDEVGNLGLFSQKLGDKDTGANPMVKKSSRRIVVRLGRQVGSWFSNFLIKSLAAFERYDGKEYLFSDIRLKVSLRVGISNGGRPQSIVYLQNMNSLWLALIKEFSTTVTSLLWTQIYKSRINSYKIKRWRSFSWYQQISFPGLHSILQIGFRLSMMHHRAKLGLKNRHYIN